MDIDEGLLHRVSSKLSCVVHGRAKRESEHIDGAVVADERSSGTEDVMVGRRGRVAASGRSRLVSI